MSILSIREPSIDSLGAATLIRSHENLGHRPGKQVSDVERMRNQACLEAAVNHYQHRHYFVALLSQQGDLVNIIGFRNTRGYVLVRWDQGSELTGSVVGKLLATETDRPPIVVFDENQFSESNRTVVITEALRTVSAALSQQEGETEFHQDATMPVLNFSQVLAPALGQSLRAGRTHYRLERSIIDSAINAGKELAQIPLPLLKLLIGNNLLLLGHSEGHSAILTAALLNGVLKGLCSRPLEINRIELDIGIRDLDDATIKAIADDKDRTGGSRERLDSYLTLIAKTAEVEDRGAVTLQLPLPYQQSFSLEFTMGAKPGLRLPIGPTERDSAVIAIDELVGLRFSIHSSPYSPKLKSFDLAELTPGSYPLENLGYHYGFHRPPLSYYSQLAAHLASQGIQEVSELRERVLTCESFPALAIDEGTMQAICFIIVRSPEGPELMKVSVPILDGLESRSNSALATLYCANVALATERPAGVFVDSFRGEDALRELVELGLS